MGYIPRGAKWYLADVVVEIFVEAEARNVVHTNRVLIRADSLEEAYERALQIGQHSELVYENPEGKRVTSRFRGLRDLNVIHDELEHGAELSYQEDIGMSEEALSRWISRKEELGVFAPIRPSIGPNYTSKDVMERVYKAIPQLRPELPEDDG